MTACDPYRVANATGSLRKQFEFGIHHLALLGTNDSCLLESKTVKYAFIDSLRGRHAIDKMCNWLEISRSGHYKWRHHVPSEQALRRSQIYEAVVVTFDRFKKRYGAEEIANNLTVK